MKTLKKWILAGVIVAVVAAGLGLWYYLGHTSADPVYVYPFQYVGMTEFWGDSRESYGPVTTDKVQTVFVTDSLEITEIFVSQGDTVKKGDVLLAFDTTLTDLALERARLNVEKLKLRLQEAQDRLQQIKWMRPMVIPTQQPEPDENLGSPLSGNYRISNQKTYDGTTAEKALICWVSSSAYVDESILEALRLAAEEYQNYNAEEKAREEETEYTPFTVNSYFAVFKVTQGNMSLGSRTTWQCLRVIRDPYGTFTFRFADTVISDHMLAETGEDKTDDEPEIDMGSGYTAAQLAEMRNEQEKVIKDLELQIRMAEAEYKIMQAEMGDGKVYAQIDGEVVSVLSPEEAESNGQPVVKVSGGGGFYIQGSVSELEKDQLKIGQEVTVNDWNTGASYTGTVSSVGDFPVSDGYWSGSGNPNASYYPFYVYVDAEADLQQGRYVSIIYADAESSNGIYLENPFIRTENGRSYVLVMGEDGCLEQRFVTTGKSLWGNYTEILEGITPEDLIAFPYGRNVRPGVPAVEGDMNDLYGG